MLPVALRPGAYLPSRAKDELDWTKAIGKGAPKERAKRVQEHLTLNGFAVVIDGDYGPATEKRVRDFQGAKGLPVTGSVDFATWQALVDPLVRALQPIAAGGRTYSELALAYCEQHVAQHPREAGGDNRGPWVRMYLDWDGPDARWCAGFVCYALEQAADTLKVPVQIPSSASCDTLQSGAKAAKLYHDEKSVAKGTFAKTGLVPGSLFLVRKASNDWVHVGMIKAARADSFDTLEGNTDSGGSANGFEAAERSRGYASKDFIVWR